MSVTRSSESVVQHREGPDLDALVEQIAAEHPAPVRFLDVDRVRRGGVMGFFAKEQYALSYQVAQDVVHDIATVTASTTGRHAEAAATPVDLEALLGSADSCDVGPSGPCATPDAGEAGSVPMSVADDRFADLLMSLAAENISESTPNTPLAGHQAGRHHAGADAFQPLQSATLSRHRAPDATTASASAGGIEPPVGAGVAPTGDRHVAPVVGTAADVTAGITPAAASPVQVARGTAVPSAALAALGVPPGWNTAEADPTRVAEVVAAVLALPPAPSTPTAPGAVVVLLTDRPEPSDDVIRHLSALASGGTKTATDRDGAVRAVADLRAAGAPGVLTVRSSRTSTLLATIAALQPELTVLEVEATGKTGDHRRRLDIANAAGLRIDALAVVRAEETASPATVWELDVPILSVDGRTSDVGVWAGLLLAADRD